MLSHALSTKWMVPAGEHTKAAAAQRQVRGCRSVARGLRLLSVDAGEQSWGPQKRTNDVQCDDCPQGSLCSGPASSQPLECHCLSVYRRQGVTVILAEADGWELVVLARMGHH